MIVYDDLGEKMMALFPPLAEDQIYLEHLCPSVAGPAFLGNQPYYFDVCGF